MGDTGANGTTVKPLMALPSTVGVESPRVATSADRLAGRRSRVRVAGDGKRAVDATARSLRPTQG